MTMDIIARGFLLPIINQSKNPLVNYHRIVHIVPQEAQIFQATIAQCLNSSIGGQYGV
jgi:hypothetical protein